MARRRRRDPRKEQHWRRLLGQWRRSGQGVREFCAARGLSEQSLYWWRRELADRDRQPAAAPAPPPRFVPVQVRAEPAAAPRDGRIEVVLANGRRLRAGAGVDPRRLADLARALEAPAC